MKSVHEIVRDAETQYTSGQVTIGKYVNWSMHETIETADAYLNSKHTSGPTDALGRDKPFFNIVTAAVNIWYRATDIDRSNIRLLPSSQKQIALAFIANVILQNWMRESGFGTFLNDWGRSLARYGSSVPKFVEKNGELVASVVPWNRMIPDQIDFAALPAIEKFYKTPAQLLDMATPGHPHYAGYDLEAAESLLDAIETRKTMDGQNKDNKPDFIELYEVHGLMDTRLLQDDPDWDAKPSFSQQMHVIASVEDKDDGFKDFTLYRGREKKDPYMLTHLIREDGRTLAIGAVEHLFEAQWMTNHTQKNVKDTLDLSSKIILQSADAQFTGRNVLSNIETGDILIHADQKPLTLVNNDSRSLDNFIKYGQQWQALAQEITSTPDAIRGNTLPSGTPYSLAAYSGGQANSLFEIMTENKGLHIEEMMYEHILPFIKKKMNNKEEIVAILDEHGIAEIDAMYVPREAVRRHNAQVKEALLNGEVPSPYQADVMEAQVRKELGELGNKRFFKPDELDEKTWNEALDDFFDGCKVIVEVTNEQSDKQAVLTTLSSVLQTIAANPAILQDQNARMVFSQILTETGKISPMQLSAANSAAPPTPTVAPPAALPIAPSNATAAS